MGNNTKIFKTHSLPLIKQKVSLESNYKNATCEIDDNQLCWLGKVKPTAFSKEYNLIILYKINKAPEIWVIGDELEKIEDKNFPHIYDKKIDKKMVRICLYRNYEFNHSMYLSNTIVPWAIEWLYYYELWLLTDKWLGGGVHPTNVSNKKEIRKRYK